MQRFARFLIQITTMRSLLCTLVFVTGTVLVSATSMDTVYRWKYIDYSWESEAVKKWAIDTGAYNYTKVLPMDVDKAPDGRVFLAINGNIGAPAALVTVTNQIGPSGPLVKPYPDWSYFKRGDCNTIQNVFRIAIDGCERLWVLNIGYLDNEPITCEPQLLTFDLKTDKLIQRIKIPNHIARGKNNLTLLATPIVETKGYECEDTTVFMADPLGPALIVWNNGNLVRLEHQLFEASKGAENITSGKFQVQWPAGIVTMAISPKNFPGEESLLYFHALASFDLYAASTELLKSIRYGTKPIEFFGAKSILSSQAVGIAFSAGGTLFLGLTKESAIACWNKYRELEPSNVEIVTQDSARLEYANGLKVICDPYSGDEELWVFTNKLITNEFNRYDFDEYNFHVVKSSVNKLIAGTQCEMPLEVRRKLELINEENEDDDAVIFSN